MDDPWDDEPAEEEPSPHVYLAIAIVFGCGLGVIALFLGWASSQQTPAGLDFLAHTNAELAAGAGWGLLAAVPMVAGFLLIDRFGGTLFADLHEIADEYVGPMFVDINTPGLFLAALATGVGEEMLFRGFLQGWLAETTTGALGPWVALSLAAIVFGLCHYFTFNYFVIATLLGAYLGAAWIWTGSLLTPIVAHAAYDFFAFWYISRFKTASSDDEEDEQ